jgi:hypothetical protein
VRRANSLLAGDLEHDDLTLREDEVELSLLDLAQC